MLSQDLGDLAAEGSLEVSCLGIELWFTNRQSLVFPWEISSTYLKLRVASDNIQEGGGIDVVVSVILIKRRNGGGDVDSVYDGDWMEVQVMFMMEEGLR